MACRFHLRAPVHFDSTSSNTVSVSVRYVPLVGVPCTHGVLQDLFLTLELHARRTLHLE
jgi:hypothetical protein